MKAKNNMDVMVATPQAIFKDIPKEDGQKPHNEGREGDAKVGLSKADPTRLPTRTGPEIKRVWVKVFNPFN